MVVDLIAFARRIRLVGGAFPCLLENCVGLFVRDDRHHLKKTSIFFILIS